MELKEIKWAIRRWSADVWHFITYRFWYDIKLTWDWYWNVLRYDQDWDWTSICSVLKYKLERTRKCLEQGHHLRADRDARQIRICELLLDRIEKDRYLENAFINHDKKWGELRHSWEKTEHPNLSKMIFSRLNTRTPAEEAQEMKESLRLYKHEHDMDKQDLELLGKYLAKYLKNWWD